MLAHAGGPPPDGRLGAARVDHRRPRRRRCGSSRRPTCWPRAARRRRDRHAPEPAVAVAGGGRRGRRPRVRRALARRAGRRRRRRGRRHRRAGRAPRRPRPASRRAVLTDTDGNTLATAVVTARRQRLPHVGAAARRRGSARTSSGASRAPARSRSACSDAIPARSRSRPPAPTHEPRDHHRGRGWRAGEPQRTRRGRRRRLTRAIARISPRSSIRVASRRRRTPREFPPTPRRDAWQSTTRGCATCSSSRTTCTPTR